MVVDETDRLLGIFTDGDLVRKLAEGLDVQTTRVADVMTLVSGMKAKARAGWLAMEASRVLRESKVDEMPVIDDDGKLVGVLDVQDLLDARLV